MILKADKIAELLKKTKYSDSSESLSITPCPDIKEIEQSGAALVPDFRWYL